MGPGLPTLPGWMQGSAFFLGGVCLVVYGWTLVGFLLETYGFWLLFSAFFPVGGWELFSGLVLLLGSSGDRRRSIPWASAPGGSSLLV